MDRNRYKFTFKKRHGEKQDADDVGAESWITDVLPGIIKDYIPSNIFNIAETGLYWKAIPDGTFSFKTSEVPGAKVSKDRITVVLAASTHLSIAYNAKSNAWMII